MDNRTFTISLTGKDSHKAVIPKGQGSFSIGTKGISEGKYDVWVEKDSVINWDAFNELYTGYGQDNKDKFPYGDWPRWIYYSGNDTGFIEWSSKRAIEEFRWMPKTDRNVDFSNANIPRLYIHTENSKIQVSTGAKTHYLALSGNLENFDFKECVKIPRLSFHLDCSQEKISYQLPLYKTLSQAACVAINNSPVQTAFDCASLLQFPHLKYLDLNGNMTNLNALIQLRELEGMELRYIPDLQDMPKLSDWDNLKHFIGWNIEENAGKRFREELKQLKKERTMSYVSITKLRKQIWFDTEYGIPFSGWETKQANVATKAYKNCFSRIKKSETESEIQEAVIEFIKKINRLDNMETVEREDIGIAISQLIENSSLEIPAEKWMQWFNEARDF